MPEIQRDPAELRPGELVLLALGAALLSGLLQNLARLAALLGGKPWDHGIHVFWMAPLAELIVIGVIALIVGLLGIWLPFLRRTRVVLVLLAWPAILSVLLLTPRLHVWARMLLALGVAVQVGALAAWRPALFRSIVRPSVTALLLVTLGAAGSVVGWSVFTERRDARSLGPSRPGAPNVVLLIWDTVRASSLSLYGHRRATTPHLDSLARTGVTFDRAYSTASYTLPSHASIFTGQWAHELGITWRTPLDEDVPTLAGTLREAGYQTAGFSGNRIFVTRAWGLGSGFTNFHEHRLGVQLVFRSGSLMRAIAGSDVVRNLLSFDDALARVHAEDNISAALGWLRRADGSRPYFAFINFMDAHAPYLPPAPYDSVFGGYASDDERRQARRRARMDPDFIPHEEGLATQPAYEGAIAALDAAVGSMLDTMDREGFLENTIVVISSDHGEEFGEHGLFGHGSSLYAQSIHVPLVVVYPGRTPGGQRVAQVVSNRDIAATVLDLAGLPPSLPGTSLRLAWESTVASDSAVAHALLTGDERLPPIARSRLGDLASVLNARRQVIRNPDGSLEVFDLDANRDGNVALPAPDSLASLLVPKLATRTSREQ